MKSRRLAVLCMALLWSGQVVSADLVAPPEPEPKEEKGIWGAIAYSSVDTKHGFFWGADKRQEAKDAAMKYCENAGGKGCTVVTVFRNHRHWTDDDETGFPYKHCGALAVAKEKQSDRLTPWGANSAETRRDAEDLALHACEAAGTECKIREWVCT
ncbi:DUF4189 domain-containing protein [Mesorhizobium sp. B292B1B]|uniref:DUF4189 domain-containing protein n=1 Tax=unclassified Mesorhizobium TaxID=325217 RepID=UPI00112BBBD6|nr:MULTISPECIES: DUF4189 domain-containing protein [unclassified Mesorhizobium]MCA0016221.1 DUF4189 domain-containing protein [Mesorhizobium sp. B294B1A1]MCA0040032.1 DUF4189 domain-containing protein [Mesorhizobium sp. B292B1B]TPM43281.1 DUF4189 domain-containing protein [Mesorhizobium sp. B2-3-2]